MNLTKRRLNIYLEEEKKKAATQQPATMDCGCASTHIQSFPRLQPPGASSCQSANIPTQHAAAKTGNSALSHWPVQIRLIPANAPFLQNADLLVAADCTAVAVRNFQEKYLEGKTVMMGCPKFDDAESYIERFAEIISTCHLKSLTVLIMEVPCCSAMNVIIKKAIEKAGQTVPVEQITISTRGEETRRTNLVSEYRRQALSVLGPRPEQRALLSRQIRWIPVGDSESCRPNGCSS